MGEKLPYIEQVKTKKSENEQMPYAKPEFLDEDFLKGASNLEFLERIPSKDRLKYISKNNITSEKILQNGAKYIDFNFHGNKKLYSMTTAGQVMPNEVRVIKTLDGQIWNRSNNNLSGEFFNKNNVRLIIGEGIEKKFKGYGYIEVGELASPEDLKNITDKKELELKKYLEENNLEENYENKDILIAIIERGLDPKVIFDIILPLVDSLSNEERSAKIEYILTGVERTRGKFHIPENKLNDFMKDYLVENKPENIISREKVSALVVKYFPAGVNVSDALRIVEAESNFDSNNKRSFYDNPGGGNDLGLFQINDYYQRKNIAKLGYTPNDMFDIEKNIRVASLVYKEAGNTWKPWVAAREMGLA